MLYNENFGCMILGCLFKNPQLLMQPQYPLTASDFSPNKFHRTMFVAVKKLMAQGCQEITPIELDNILQAHPTNLEIATDNEYMSFVETTKSLASIENYEAYYNAIRKFSLLRELKEEGFDIKDFYDEMEDETEQLAGLEKVTIQDILNEVEMKSIKLRAKYDVKYVRGEMTAGEDTEDLILQFEQAPAFGALLCSPLITQLWQGWCRGHLLMESAPSGVGKTRMSVRDLCGVSIDTIWDDTANDFIVNPNFQGPGLFIHTELKTREEINPMFLACISGVDVKHITMGCLSPEERLRVLKAGDILLANEMRLVDMADFTCQSIERKVKETVEGIGMQYAVFDYVQLNSAVTQEYRQNTAVQGREDLILRNITLELKNMAEKYMVGIKTMSQLNGVEKTIEFPDESCFSGGKSQKNKLDAACITLPVKDRMKEYKRIESYIHKRGFGKDANIKPNVVSYIVKARFGEYADQKLKVWRYFDRGRFTNIDLLCTDQYDEVVDIAKPVVETF